MTRMERPRLQFRLKLRHWLLFAAVAAAMWVALELAVPYLKNPPGELAHSLLLLFIVFVYALWFRHTEAKKHRRSERADQ
jgi:hypothetical protein